MKREIKFRGKAKNDGEWFFGNLFDNDTAGRTHICTTKKGCLDINPDTVGQFTGLLDKNGKEIYEGDIIRTKRYGIVHGQSNTQGADLFRVVYKNAQFYIDNKLRHFYLQDSKCNEVIGNIHDNPELLKEELY